MQLLIKNVPKTILNNATSHKKYIKNLNLKIRKGVSLVVLKFVFSTPKKLKSSTVQSHGKIYIF